MIVLASASPRRCDLLRVAGIEHRVVPGGVDEGADPALPPEALVVLLAERKARAAAHASGGDLVLGADTVVVLDGKILGKPGTTARARDSLRRLSGRSHEVYTGLFLLDPATGRSVSRFERTEVTFRRITAAEIDAYVETGEPLDKAGGYGVQGRAGEFVHDIKGSLDNVIGLPVETLRVMLEELA